MKRVRIVLKYDVQSEEARKGKYRWDGEQKFGLIIKEKKIDLDKENEKED